MSRRNLLVVRKATQRQIQSIKKTLNKNACLHVSPIRTAYYFFIFVYLLFSFRLVLHQNSRSEFHRSILPTLL